MIYDYLFVFYRDSNYIFTFQKYCRMPVILMDFVMGFQSEFSDLVQNLINITGIPRHFKKKSKTSLDLNVFRNCIQKFVLYCFIENYFFPDTSLRGDLRRRR